MANIGKQALKAKIDQHIYENDEQAITGEVMNIILQDMVDTLLPEGLDAGQVLVFDGDEWAVVDSTELNVGQLEGFNASDFMLALTADFIQATQPEGRLGLSWIDTANDRYMDYVAYGGGLWVENTHKSAIIEMAYVFAFNRTTQAWLTKVDGLWKVLSGGGDVKAISVNGVRINPDATGLITLPNYPSLTRYATEDWVDENYSYRIAGLEAEYIQASEPETTVTGSSWINTAENKYYVYVGNIPHTPGLWVEQSTLTAEIQRTFVLVRNSTTGTYMWKGLSGEWMQLNPDLSDYATKTWVEAKGYITAAALTGYATVDWVEGKGYLTEHQDITPAFRDDYGPYHNMYRFMVGSHDCAIPFVNLSDTHTVDDWGLWSKADVVALTNALNSISAAIPTAVSQLTNDSGYITAAALTSYYTKAQSNERFSIVDGLTAPPASSREGKPGDFVAVRQNNTYSLYACFGQVYTTSWLWNQVALISDIPSVSGFLTQTDADARYSQLGHTHSYLPLSGGAITGTTIAIDSAGLPTYGGSRVPANTLAIGRNGIGIGGIDTSNDGAAIYMENAGTEKNHLIIALGDDAAQLGADDYIAFRYYNTSGQATYESKIPFKSGTIALTSDIPTNNNQLTNGAGYITGINSAMIINALDYVPADLDYLTNNYLLKSGGAITGAITYDGGGSWISARDHCAVRTVRTSGEGSDWHPVVGLKTSAGFWSFGSVGGENLAFSHDTDADYTAGRNTSTVISMPLKSGTIALTSDIPDVSGYLPKSGGTMTGDLTLGIHNLIFSGGDAGDIVWYDGSGNETHRIWSGSDNSLYYRRSAGATQRIWHTGIFNPSDYQIASTAINTSNIGSQSVNYASSAGSADTVDGEHASAFAHIGAHNNLTASGNEFTFASSGFSGQIYLNFRTAGGTNGNITDYIFSNGKGGSLVALSTLISQSSQGATAYSWGNHASAGYAYASQLGSYLPLSGGTMTGQFNTRNNAVGINFRGYSSSSWDSWCAHETTGSEALVFGTQNVNTAIMFVNGESYGNVSSSRFQSLTPGLSIVNNSVLIGYGYTSSSSYKLDVNGSFYATSGYINGNTIYHSGNLSAATLGAMTQSAADARYWRPEVDRLASGKLSLQGGLVMLSNITTSGTSSDIGTSSDYFRFIHGSIFSVHGRIEKGGHYFRRYLGVYTQADLPGSSVAEVGDYAVAQVYTNTFVFAIYATAGGRTGWWAINQLSALL